MAVKHDILGAPLGWLNYIDYERTTTLWLVNLPRKPFDLQLTHVGIYDIDSLLNEAIGEKFGIIER